MEVGEHFEAFLPFQKQLLCLCGIKCSLNRLSTLSVSTWVIVLNYVQHMRETNKTIDASCKMTFT